MAQTRFSKGPRPQRSSLQNYLRYSHLGMQFFVSVALFTGLGVWLDRILGTVVAFTLLGLALGFGGGTYSIYKAIFGEARSSKRPNEGADRPDEETENK